MSRPLADGFLVRFVRAFDSDKKDNLELSRPVVDGFLVRFVRAFDSGWNR